MRRFLIQRPKASTYLCVVLAKGEADALRVARQFFRLPRGTLAAVEPTPHDRKVTPLGAAL